MKFEDDDLKDGKLWAALQKEIDRDLAEKESGETFQEELADIEDSIEFESKETKSEDHIPDETANLSNLRSVLEATERAKDEEAKQKMKQTKSGACDAGHRDSGIYRRGRRNRRDAGGDKNRIGTGRSDGG